MAPGGAEYTACVTAWIMQRECCLLVINLVSSTLPCIRQPRPRLSCMWTLACTCMHTICITVKQRKERVKGEYVVLRACPVLTEAQQKKKLYELDLDTEWRPSLKKGEDNRTSILSSLLRSSVYTRGYKVLVPLHAAARVVAVPASSRLLAQIKTQCASCRSLTVGKPGLLHPAN